MKRVVLFFTLSVLALLLLEGCTPSQTPPPGHDGNTSRYGDSYGDDLRMRRARMSTPRPN